MVLGVAHRGLLNVLANIMRFDKFDDAHPEHYIGSGCLPDPCDDEDDVKFLACAISGRATCVVSGDRALLRASGHEGIEVVTPRDFLSRFLDEQQVSIWVSITLGL